MCNNGDAWQTPDEWPPLIMVNALQIAVADVRRSNLGCLDLGDLSVGNYLEARNNGESQLPSPRQTCAAQASMSVILKPGNMVPSSIPREIRVKPGSFLVPIEVSHEIKTSTPRASDMSQTVLMGNWRSRIAMWASAL